ncbi:hypothetical protein Agub_g14177, partial [Astrephomene gubernaculifera]
GEEAEEEGGESEGGGQPAPSTAALLLRGMRHRRAFSSSGAGSGGEWPGSPSSSSPPPLDPSAPAPSVPLGDLEALAGALRAELPAQAAALQGLRTQHDIVATRLDWARRRPDVYGGRGGGA